MRLPIPKLLTDILSLLFLSYRSLLFKFWTLCVSEPPSVHLSLTGKCIVDFLLVLIELFCQVLSLKRYERILNENRRFRSNGVSLTPKFQVEGVTPLNILLLKKLG